VEAEQYLESEIRRGVKTFEEERDLAIKAHEAMVNYWSLIPCSDIHPIHRHAVNTGSPCPMCGYWIHEDDAECFELFYKELDQNQDWYE
jgi:hypothetical protein